MIDYEKIYKEAVELSNSLRARIKIVNNAYSQTPITFKGVSTELVSSYGEQTNDEGKGSDL